MDEVDEYPRNLCFSRPKSRERIETLHRSQNV